MNKQKPGAGIEWTHVWGRPGYTSNPVKGCKHGCEWRMPDGKIVVCYAKTIAERLAQSSYPNGFEHISFEEAELSAIARLKEPSGIFIDSMSDLFGQGVPDEWIHKVLSAISDAQQHIFFSLTKNPPRLSKFSFPRNLWVGISAPPTFMFGKELNHDQRVAWLEKGMGILGSSDAAVTWISIEPLSWDMSSIIEANKLAIDWAVVGAGSDGARNYQPAASVFKDVLDALSGKPVFFKGNISRALAMEVAGGWRAEFPNQ